MPPSKTPKRATPAVTAHTEIKPSATANPTPPKTITREQIERRAYEIYASRGYTPDDPNADWLEAERQLSAGL